MMRSLLSLGSIAALAGSAIAAPTHLVTRQINDNGTAAGGVSDVDILQYALTLEYLEINLYETVVNTYGDQDFVDAGFKAADRWTFLQIIDQELEHIANIRKSISGLGETPNQPCKYDYGTVESLNQLLNNTDAVNGLGPSAYLGSGAFVSDKLVLTTGASIGNIETRHNSWLNGLLGRSEVPTSFQLALSPTQAYSVASQFIVSGSCPDSNKPLKAITAYPPGLTITNKGYPAKPVNNGDTLYFKTQKAVNAPRVAFLTGFNTTIVDYDSSSSSAVIPSDVAGQSYAVLTTAYQGQVVNDANSLTGLAAFYVDRPSAQYSDLQFSTYQFADK